MSSVKLWITAGIVFSCATKSPEVLVSENLGTVDSNRVNCLSWPLNEESELEVKDVYLPIGIESELRIVASIRDRKGALLHYSIPFAGNSIDREKSIPLLIGKSSKVLGLFSSASGAASALIATTTKNRTTLEARTLTDNKVMAKSQFVIDGAPIGADLFQYDSDVYVTIRIEEAKSMFLRVQNRKGQTSFELVNFQSAIRNSIYAYSKSMTQGYIVEPTLGSKKIAISVRQVTKNFEVSSASSVDLSVAATPENAVVAPRDGGINIATMIGDSMVGQGRLLLASYKIEAAKSSLEWQRQEDILDFHLSDPSMILGKESLDVALFKWLNGPPVLFVVDALSKDKGLPKIYEPFLKGSALTGGVAVQGSTYVVVRNKLNEQWKYSVCSWRR